MKKSELRKIIREEIQRLDEIQTSNPYPEVIDLITQFGTRRVLQTMVKALKYVNKEDGDYSDADRKNALGDSKVIQKIMGSMKTGKLD